MEFSIKKVEFIVELYNNRKNKTHSVPLTDAIRNFMNNRIEVKIKTNTKSKHEVYLVNEYTYRNNIEFTKEDLTYYLRNFIINNDVGITVEMYFGLLDKCYNCYKESIVELKKKFLALKNKEIVDYIKILEADMGLVKCEIIKYNDIADVMGNNLVITI